MTITKPDNPSAPVSTILNAVEDAIRQEQAAKLNLPHIQGDKLIVAHDAVSLADALAIAGDGGEVEHVEAFACVDPTANCYWTDADGEAQTWQDYFDSQGVQLEPVTVDGAAYFGVTRNGCCVNAQELLALQNAGLTLLTAEQYRAAMPDPEM